MQKYNVFDLVTGRNTEVFTLEEALAAQEKVKQKFMDMYRESLVINVIQVNPDGSETWSVLPQKHSVVSVLV